MTKVLVFITLLVKAAAINLEAMAYQLASTHVTLPCFKGFDAFVAWPAPHLVS